MSGPVSATDAPLAAAVVAPADGAVEMIEGRTAQVGALPVRRVLPRRPRRTVGPWCFVDHMGPAVLDDDAGLAIGPHPHIGLQTVTWLLEGEVLHRDSLGSEQVIRPGQLNLMTAGHGVAHAEETAGLSRGELHGVQLWVAQPTATRDGDAAFEHHAELPQADVGAGVATVLVGPFSEVTSPARRDTDHVGVDLDLRGGTVTVPLAAGFEYALVVLEGAVGVAGRRLEPGALGYLGTGRDELRLEVAAPARALLLGGAPFEEPLLMWWNYVAREKAEITAAHRDWMAGAARFGEVASPLARMVIGGPPWWEPSG